MEGNREAGGDVGHVSQEGRECSEFWGFSNNRLLQGHRDLKK